MDKNTISPRQAEILAAANGGRRVRTMEAGEVARVVAKARATRAKQWGHAGDVGASYPGRAVTTVALAAWVNGRLYLGVADGAATSTTPGRAWKCLQPWGRGDMADRLVKWTEQPNVIAID